MKSIFILPFLIFSCITVRPQTPHDIVRVEFVSLTRGYYEKVVFTKDSVGMTQNRDTITSFRIIKEEEWKELIGTLDQVALSEIPRLKSPTMKRAYDGALHSSITITTSDGQTWRHGFDDENPNEKLQPLMGVILKIKTTARD